MAESEAKNTESRQVYVGAITVPKEDLRLLEEILGTSGRIAEKFETDGFIECFADDITVEDLQEFDPYWGRFVWTLVPANSPLASVARKPPKLSLKFRRYLSVF